ncbi:YciI family protein [Rubrolithibacter danxiaensis]|uniref:YciI family protein n=1 Tax=Rubrolithibacter danxiaensis TaxID=3390805 RepID=UPI003BF8BE72
MTENERNIMLQHVSYWTEYMNRGVALVFGPVFDPKGTYGLGIIAVDSEEQLTAFIENDPAGKINRYEYYPMRAVLPSNTTDLL